MTIAFPPDKILVFYTPAHGFIHKILIAAFEAGIWDKLTFVPIYPRRDGYYINAINPLAKVPTIALPDGTVLYGSQTIVEYFDSFNTTSPLYPASGTARWDALRRLGLADITFDVTTRVCYEHTLKTPNAEVVEWNWPKLVRALDQMDKDAASLTGFDIGQAATLHAVSYLEWHMTNTVGLLPPVPKAYDWRIGRPALKAWWDKAIQRPSVQNHFQKTYVGDTSVEYAQAAIQHVLDLQQARKG